MKFLTAKVFSLRRKQNAFLVMDLVIAMSIFAIAIIPLAFSFSRENKLLCAEYHRAAAMEIIDGEMEILAAAGNAKTFPEGARVYEVHAASATNLPPGKFLLTKTSPQLRLEWKTDKQRVAAVIREISLK